MSNFNRLLLGLTCALAVAGFVLALWPVVADAPWEDDSAEIIQAEHEAERLEKCIVARSLEERWMKYRSSHQEMQA